MKCITDDCELPVLAQDRCNKHYQRYLNNGGRRLDHLDKLLTRIEPNENGCWIWQGLKDKRGYGRTNVGGGTIRNTHVVFYNILVGDVPKGLELDHLCMTQSCVNPDHLEPVTHTENMKRWANTLNITHCPQGHEYDSVNTYVNPKGRRICRICSRKSGQRYRKRVAYDI